MSKHDMFFLYDTVAEQSLDELPLEELLQQMLTEDAAISAPRRPNEQGAVGRVSVHVYMLPLMLESSCSPADETLSDGSDWSLDESSTDDVPAGISCMCPIWNDACPIMPMFLHHASESMLSFDDVA